MTKRQQKGFVKELSKAVVEDLVLTIDKDRVPDTFDGHELRVILAEMFMDSSSLSLIRKYPYRKRASDYRNWRRNTPLWSR